MDEPDQLLKEWFEWWLRSPDAPPNLPNHLHVRTAICLQVKDLLTQAQEVDDYEKDDLGDWRGGLSV